MKFKHKVLALMLTAAMLVVSMPLTSFAGGKADSKIAEKPKYGTSGISIKTTYPEGSVEFKPQSEETDILFDIENLYYDEEEGDWSTDDYFEDEDKIVLTIGKGSGAKSYEYSFDWDLGWTSENAEAPEIGSVWMATKDDVESMSAGNSFAYNVYVGIHGSEGWEVYISGNYSGEKRWVITNNYDTFFLVSGSAKMEVKTDYEGSSAVSYQWYRYDYDLEDWVIIPGETKKICVASETGEYLCEVEIDGLILNANYEVSFDYYTVLVGNLYYELNSEREQDQAGVWSYKEEPQGSLTIADKVTLKNGKTYTVTQVHALYDMQKVTQITIPATVTEIEDKTIGYYGYNEFDEPAYNKVPGFTIFGTTGTAAQRYAAENGFAFRDLQAEAAAAAAAAELARLQSITTITVNTKTVNAAAIKKAIADAGGSSQYITKIVLGKKVKKISKKAFAGVSNVTSLEIKTKKLKAKSVKDCLKGSKIKSVKVNVGAKKANKKAKKSYKKIFTKKIAGKKVKIK